MASNYVHGYSEREAQRLREQSLIVEELLHGDTHYPAGAGVLEAGCGVGAQTLILARRHPQTRFTSIDLSPESVAQAQHAVAAAGRDNVTFAQADLLDLPFDDETFDHVFVCFVLEHLPDPVAGLRSLRRVLRTGGTLTAIEGDHDSCFYHPVAPAARRVWQCLIDCQARLGCDGLIGRRAYPLVVEAGFRDVQVTPRVLYADASSPTLRSGMVHQIIVPMVQSSRAQALREGMLTEAEWDAGIAALEQSDRDPDGTFFYSWFKAVGVK